MIRIGSSNISTTGATAISVAFGYTFDAIPDTVLASLENTTDTDYLLIYPFVVAKSTTGCTFELSGAVDSNNYNICWLASDDSEVTGGAGTTGATGAAAVPAKPINRIAVATSVAANDYILMQSTSGGAPVTLRVSLATLKTFTNS